MSVASNVIPLRMAQVRPDPQSRVVTEIYKPFFVAGVIAVLTAGCALGAVALMGISLAGSYVAPEWTPYVLAHANSQLYGWVGFFVIGFALQQHAPRFERRALFHKVAFLILTLMAIGIGLRFAAEPLAHIQPSVWVPVGVAAGILQLIAVLLFIAIPGMTRFRTGRPLPWQAVLTFASLGWWVLVAAAEPVYFWFAHYGPSNFVQHFYPPLRDAQFLGFVSLMIFSVALVKLNSCFGFREANKPLALAAFAFWTGGLFARILGWLLFYGHGMAMQWYWVFYAGGFALAISAVLFAAAIGVFEESSLHLPSNKFVRTAFAWLIVAGALTVYEPFHLHLAGMPFSHALTGAIRHALTVGFISQMILGVGLHVVNQMNEVPRSQVPAIWVTFWLVNVGNALRVGCQLATDFNHGAFVPMGVSGVLELGGIVFWAGALGLMTFGRKRLAHV